MKGPSVNFGFRIPIDLLRKLRVLAKHECRSTASMIRVLIYDCVDTFEAEHGRIE